MAKSAPFAQVGLEHYFQNAAIPNVGNVGGLLGSTVAGSLFVSAHTAFPAFADPTQDDNENAYTSYARVGVTRTAGSWPVTTTGQRRASNTAQITFPQAGSGPEDWRYVGIGRQAAGATELDYINPLATQDSQPFVVDDSLADNVLIVPNHTYVDTNEVYIRDVEGSSLPTGLSNGDIVFVVNAVADQFQVEATIGGGPILLTNGAGRVALVSTRVINASDTPQIGAGSLLVIES